MRQKRHLFHAASLIALTLLSACASKQKVPQIAYDDLTAFDTATYQPEPVDPVKIVTLPEPLPLPGQMKPAPVDNADKTSAASKDKRPPTKRIADANQAAKIEPTKDGYINAIQNYPFVKGALYQLYAAVNQVSDIALEPGEKLISVSAGDTVRWVVGDTKSGVIGKNGTTLEQVHILVKPISADLQTNLVINTDHRTYHLEMRSTNDTYMASVSWVYPHSDLLALQRQNTKSIQSAKLTIDRGLNLDRLKFRYNIEGDAPWKPIRAFDDGHKVYLQFPSGIKQGDAPPLFILSSNGEPALVNYRVKDNYYIIDRLFAAAELRFGTNPQQIVRITRRDAKYKTIKTSKRNIWEIDRVRGMLSDG